MSSETSLVDVSPEQLPNSQTNPQNAPAFDDFPLGAELREALTEMHYEAPTDVQVNVIEPALAGRDLVVQAKTGSGKTAAFGIPLVERLDPTASQAGLPRALVLTPTRELALQVAKELHALGSKKGTKVVAIYGGVPMGRQTTALKEGVDIVVGTPGRLLDHLRRRHMAFDAIETMVLDEADEMLSMGFWDDVTDLLKLAPKRQQTMLFSATLPYQVARAAAQFLSDPQRVDVSGDDLTVDGIENCIIHVAPEIPKPRQLLYVLETQRPDSAIIFCNTRNEAEMIAKYLMQSGFMAEPLTGSFCQTDRERVMGRIKSGELRYMVATDVAARGIDVADLSHVLNYALPEFSEVYLHRVGRTGRIGKRGVALSLVDGKGLGTLSVLEREFGIGFVEKHLPPEPEVLRLRSERIMKELSEKASVAEVGQHLPVATTILEGEDAAQVVAFLLKSYFNQQAEPERRSNGRGERKGKAPTSVESAPAKTSSTSTASQADSNGAGRRRRRRRRRRPGDKRADAAGSDGGDGGGAAAAAGEASGGGVAVSGNGNGNGSGNGNGAAPDDGFTRIRVNIGFDDGFKGRGAVAKKISALAGLNDGIVTEVAARRDHAVLKASREIAEMVLERVDGAQIGKKVVCVSLATTE